MLVVRLHVLLLAFAPAAIGADWITLPKTTELTGWTAHGNAEWSIRNGTIAGRQGPEGAGGDLISERQWSDFELEAEWRMTFPGNSGIWFRYMGPNTGYQADFLDQASHPGVLSGSLYCMGRALIAKNRDAATVNRNGWNRIRIRVQGDHIVITQNGKQVVNVRDSTFRGPGSIGIQVHAGKEFDGMEVRVRNLRVQPLRSASQ